MNRSGEFNFFWFHNFKTKLRMVAVEFTECGPRTQMSKIANEPGAQSQAMCLLHLV